MSDNTEFNKTLDNIKENYNDLLQKEADIRLQVHLL